jgi:alanyl-tRNA synthetase
MGKGFLDDVEGTRGNGFHSVADLQNMPQYKKDELKAAIEANNARLREAALSSAQKKKDAEAAKIVEEQKKAKQKAQAEYKASQAQKEKNKAAAAAALAPRSKGQAQAKQIVATSKKRKTKSGATVGGKADTQKNLNKVNKQLKNIASGGSGGFNKGGLMKKPNKK